MKLCPNCQFENFKNPEYCERCSTYIHHIKNENFQMFDFIKRNSGIYVVIGVLLTFANNLSKPDDSFRTGASFVSALLAIILICVLIYKSWDYCSTSRPCKDALKIFIYMVVHSFLIFSIFLFYGLIYLPIISLFVGLMAGLIIPSELREQLRKRVSLVISGICITIFIIVYLSTIFIWNIFPKTDVNIVNYVNFGSSLILFSMGGLLSSTIVIFIFNSDSGKILPDNFFERVKQGEIGPGFKALLGFIVLLLLIFLTSLL